MGDGRTRVPEAAPAGEVGRRAKGTAAFLLWCLDLELSRGGSSTPFKGEGSGFWGATPKPETVEHQGHLSH